MEPFPLAMPVLSSAPALLGAGSGSGAAPAFFPHVQPMHESCPSPQLFAEMPLTEGVS